MKPFTSWSKLQESLLWQAVMNSQNELCFVLILFEMTQDRSVLSFLLAGLYLGFKGLL